MTKIAYFGQNPGDAAVRRRIVALQQAGFHVTGFMPRRGEAGDPPCEIVDLGETADNAYVQRIASIFRGAKLAGRQADVLRRSNLIIARNLDMLATAVLVRSRLGLAMPVIYECLDIHKKLTGSGAVAKGLRALERSLLKRTALVVLSSPAFEREHFARYYPGAYRSFLVENRLIDGDAFPDRPVESNTPSPRGKLKIGWFGNLRCARSLAILGALADRFPEQVEIVLRGYPAPGVFADFEGLLAPHANITFHGRYRAPQDLAAIYGEVDLVWAGDWYEEGANSLWLLPNRIYEGGYFAVPQLAPAGTETARRIAAQAGGAALQEPVEEALANLIAGLLQDPAPIAEWRANLLSLPRETFVETPETMQQMVAAARGTDRQS
ncbi:MAG: glycosyl transferase family 1 [Pseudomonadota bacterium]